MSGAKRRLKRIGKKVKKMGKNIADAHIKVLSLGTVDGMEEIGDIANDMTGKTAAKEAKRESERQIKEQAVFQEEAKVESDRVGEISDAQSHRANVKARKRKIRRAGGGGGLLSSGDTGINQKTRLGQ
ncbi:MAG: hypothetical protein DRP97_03015 [Candidatus Latescibacterota bacterium]|nr:MAG: hypothetical protein DRP97_03015 [Candidatus Latescibacterota bacterium]